MRLIGLFLILCTLPAFYSFLRQNPSRRAQAFTLFGLMMFSGGNLRINTFLIAWPLWTGTVRGLELSPVDTLALAIVLTRSPMRGALPFWGTLFLYGGAVFLSVIVSAVPMASLFSLWQFLRLVLIFAAVGGEAHRSDVRAGLVSGLSLGLLLQAAYVIPQKLSGVVQAAGSIGHQNALGMMVELSLIPILAAMLAGDRRGLTLAGVVAALVVIAGGGSRGTMSFTAGGIVALIVLSMMRGSTPNKQRVLGLAVIGVVLAVPPALYTLNNRFAGGSYVTDESERDAFERSARAMAADHPLGVGANMYITTANMQGYAARAGVAWNYANRAAPVHNAYLLARAETGWFGEIAFIMLLAVPLLRGLYFAFSTRMSAATEAALGASVALTVNLIHNNVEFNSHVYGVAAFAYMNMGVIAAQLRGAKVGRPSGQGGPGRRTAGGREMAGLASAGAASPRS